MSWALVTGAAARGGAAICRSLHAAGQDVVLHHSSRSAQAARRLADDLLALRQGSVKLWECDFDAVPQIPSWLTELAPEVCVCNASVYQPSDLGDRGRATEDWAVHVSAHAAILDALKGGLRSVVGVSDIHVARPGKGYVWYTVAKAGLQTLLLTLALEWAPRIRCNVVAPGTLPFPEDWADKARIAAIEASVPMARLGTFEDLAGAVKWLALDAPYVTGHVLAIDGGRGLWLP
jgi:pteridine reductase